MQFARFRAQAEFDGHRLAVVVGSSRGGAVAMNIGCEKTPLLLCPAKKGRGRPGRSSLVRPSFTLPSLTSNRRRASLTGHSAGNLTEGLVGSHPSMETVTQPTPKQQRLFL